MRYKRNRTSGPTAPRAGGPPDHLSARHTRVGGDGDGDGEAERGGLWHQEDLVG